MLHILLADDHPLFRLALAQAVRAAAPEARLSEAGSLDEARQVLDATPAELVLLDLHMPGNRGLLGLAMLRGEFPATAVAIVSADDEPAVIRRALAHGACGFVSKRSPLPELTRALALLLTGGDYTSGADVVLAAPADAEDRTLAHRLAQLTPQQMRVLALVADGLQNKQVADRLGVQERTIKAHMSAIFERLGVRNRTQAGVLLRSLELAAPESLGLSDPA